MPNEGVVSMHWATDHSGEGRTQGRVINQFGQTITTCQTDGSGAELRGDDTIIESENRGRTRWEKRVDISYPKKDLVRT